MIAHSELGDSNFSRLRQLKILINKRDVQLGGNSNLKIYGMLNCKSGKRLKVKNRVFFATEKDAIEAGYRPCGHCIRAKYQIWKNSRD